MRYSRFFTLLLLLLGCTSAMAQKPCYDKMSPLLRQLVRQQQHRRSAPTEGQSDASRRVCAFVRTADSQSLADYGCRELLRRGSIAIADIPLQQLARLSADPRVLRIEASQGMHCTLDSTAMHVNATAAYQGVGLPQCFKGEGVVVGVMDIGFDLTHPSFRTADLSDLRIGALWDMLSTDTIGSRYYVGRDYEGTEQLLALQTTRDGHAMTHGTHVAGIAAGNGFTSDYCGLAPESDLCLVANAVSDNSSFIAEEDLYKYTFATDALGFKYIFDYADRLGRPCVINLSQGSHQDFYGYDQLYYEMLDSLVGPGHIIVASAGNEAWRKTWFEKPKGQPSAGTLIDCGSKTMLFTLKGDAPFALRLRSYGGHTGEFVLPTDSVLSRPDSLYAALAEGLGVALQVEVEAYPSSYDPLETCYDVKLTGEKAIRQLGELSLELVGEGAHVEFFRMSGDIKPHATNPLLGYGEATHSILSPSSAPRVICVGATTYREQIINMEGKATSYWMGRDGKRVEFSSMGPTFDGRTKPDVVAPGNNVVSSYNSFYTEANAERYDKVYDVGSFDFDGRTYYWTSESGTSMSAPVVAGAIALWLQAKPDLTPEEVLHVLSQTCTHPDATLAYPNNEYGYGQIDVYRGLLLLTGLSGIKDVSQQHTRATVTLSGNCLTVSLPQTELRPVLLRLYAADGRQVFSCRLPSGQTAHAVSLPTLSRGIYAVELTGSAAVSGSTLLLCR